MILIHGLHIEIFDCFRVVFNFVFVFLKPTNALHLLFGCQLERTKSRVNTRLPRWFKTWAVGGLNPIANVMQGSFAQRFLSVR